MSEEIVHIHFRYIQVAIQSPAGYGLNSITDISGALEKYRYENYINASWENLSNNYFIQQLFFGLNSVNNTRISETLEKSRYQN